MNPDRDFLLDIIELIETIERHRPETQEELIDNEVLLTAVIHWVQTVGEAANAISDQLRAEHPDIPWRQIVDMRNLLAHGYRHVDPAIMWHVVIRDPSQTGDADSRDRGSFRVRRDPATRGARYVANKRCERIPKVPARVEP